MEAASRSRRIRLEELKRRKATYHSNGANGHNREIPTVFEFDEEDEDEARIKNWSTTKLVRSFRVKDAKLKVDYTQLKDTIEKDVAGLQEGVIAADEVRRKEELDLTNIAPKKPNWDLKRDLDKRLAKLSRRDKEARLILIRQRISAATKGGGASVGAEAAAVAAEGLVQEAASDDDDSD
ncbi:hypothetical protein CBS101457_004758 [Exobasidium rhododendri]|nr:hypothetical protein CBS101457_004758 [Exobasidium rhododendri]